MNVRGYEIYGLSPLAMSLLWLSKNAVLKDMKEMTPQDVDEVIFLTYSNDVPLDLKALKETSKDFCILHEISPEDALEIVITSLKLAFLPLKQIYTSTEKLVSSEPVFDADWLADLVACVTKMTKLEPEKIMRTPLNVCYRYYLSYLKQEKIRNVDKIPDQEIIKEMDFRTCELVIDYLIEKKVIRKKSREKYLNIISNGALNEHNNQDKL